ncbi:hypothetical protein [Fimbriimonas ginsengisoli]|uniref:Uncharacterized protein n=1 Tax=Fimbriimonas ginsengisoli Gsoil 348 TaxID=661478 RepID=A0A068NRI7_FIMGI|nr:hypothetical protein [Fimbriimonas ginsengisoli]AIE86138.1 hypothetical protein OP10G_2770 [Fimbriimonas ginsengisoli Gsoil 348]
MRRRLILIVLISTLSAVGLAQQPGGSALDTASSWLRTQWQRVQNEGRPAAERVVRQFPERFKNMRSQIARISKLASDFSDDHHLTEKKELLVELWRVRGSVNLLALLSPDMLHQLTGMDTKTLTTLQSQLDGIRAKLSKG